MSRFGSITRRAMATALVTVIWTAIPGTAFAHWTQSSELSSSTGALLPTVAANSHGSAVSAWYKIRGNSVSIIAKVSGDGGQHWSAGQNLGAASVALGDAAPAIVRVAVNDDGVAVVVWQQMRADHQLAVVASAPPGGAFGTAQVLSASNSDACYPDVVADGHNFVVVWVTQSTLEDVLLDKNGAIIERGTVAGGLSSPDHPTAAGDGGQRLAFAWTEVDPTTGGSTSRISVARKTMGHSTPVITAVSLNGVSNPIGLAMSGSGQTTVVWTDLQGNGVAEVIDAASAAWGKGFGKQQQLSTSNRLAIPGGGGGGSRGVGIDSSGRVSAIWVEGDQYSATAGGRVRVATSNPAGVFREARTVQADGASWCYERPAIAVSPGGTVVATWTRYNMDRSRVWASVGRASGAFSTPVRLSPVGGDCSAVTSVDSAGDAIAVWYTGNVDTARVQFSCWKATSR